MPVLCAAVEKRDTRHMITTPPPARRVILDGQPHWLAEWEIERIEAARLESARRVQTAVMRLDRAMRRTTTAFTSLAGAVLAAWADLDESDVITLTLDEDD